MEGNLVTQLIAHSGFFLSDEKTTVSEAAVPFVNLDTFCV